MGHEQIEYTFFWTIKNYSYCCCKNGRGLSSPLFNADEIEKTSWKIGLFPRGAYGHKGYVSFTIFRPETDDGPEEVSIRFELSLLALDGSPLADLKGDSVFRRKYSIGDEKFLNMHQILLLRKDDYLPRDTLTARCKIWKGVGDILRVEPIFSTTIIQIRKICFLLEVKNFSKMKDNQIYSVKFRLHSQEKTLVKCNLYFTQDFGEGKVMVEIVSSHRKYVLSKVKFFLLGSNNLILCGGDDNRYDFERKNISKLPLHLTRKEILDKKSEYFPEGKLYLLCKCVFGTTGKCVFSNIEEIQHEIPVYAENMIGTQGEITLNAEKKQETLRETPVEAKEIEGAERKVPLDACEKEETQRKMHSDAGEIEETENEITLNSEKREETQLEITLDPEKIEGDKLEMPADAWKKGGTQRNMHSDAVETKETQGEITLNAEKREETQLEMPEEDEKKVTQCDMPVDSENMKETQLKLPVGYSIQTNTLTLGKNEVISTKGFSARPNVSEDLKVAYINKCLTDIEVKTKTKSFFAHRTVLFVRSPVFKAMVADDNTDCIQVDDLEDEVVDRFLLFLYSETVGNLDWRLASLLYFAANQYQVDVLKEVCSNFLVENLTPNRAGGILLLADRQGDSHLKKSAEDFIIERDKEVFLSDEWEELMETNPTLAMKAMHLKYKREKGEKTK